MPLSGVNVLFLGDEGLQLAYQQDEVILSSDEAEPHVARTCTKDVSSSSNYPCLCHHRCTISVLLSLASHPCIRWQFMIPLNFQWQFYVLCCVRLQQVCEIERNRESEQRLGSETDIESEKPTLFHHRTGYIYTYIHIYIYIYIYIC